MRVAITYAVVGWVIMQVASLTFEGFGIPIWAFRFVMLMVILGFPIAIILAWAFELTPDGIKTTKSAQDETEVTEAHSKKRNWLAYAVGAVIPTVIFTVFLFGTMIDDHLEWDAWIMLGFFLHARPGSIRIETCLERNEADS